MTKALVEFMRHVIQSSSMRPVWTFWLVACGVVPLATAEWIGLGAAVSILTVTAVMMVWAASHRDDRIAAAKLLANVEHVTDVVDAQREALEARVRVLIAALIHAGVKVPPEEH